MSIKHISIPLIIIASLCTIYSFCNNFFLEALSKLSLSLVLMLILLLTLSTIILISYIFYLRKRLKEETSPVDITPTLKAAQERLKNIGTGKTKNP